MSNGLSPLPANGVAEPMDVDEGTLARTESPNPMPIGLDARSGAKGGSAKGGRPSVADQIVAYARHRLAQRVGDGECYTLANRALGNAVARTAADYGEVTPNADYVWGSPVTLSDLRPGDVIQLRNYQYERTVDVNNPDGSGSTNTVLQERPHHTAIVQRVEGSVVTVLEQNAPDGSPVATTRLYFANSETTSGSTTTRVTVSGTWWFYRPQTP